MSDILYCEWLKLKRSKIAAVGMLGTLIVPMLVLFNGVQRHLKNSGSSMDLFGLYDDAILFLMLLFAPLVISVVATYLISREYAEKTLKTIFTVPISRKSFLGGKLLILFVVVMLFMLVSWFNILALAVICSLFFNITGITAMSSVYFLFKMLWGGILLYMTITPVIYLAIWNKGFVTPFIVIAAVCLLNVVLSNSPIAGFFPWTAAYLIVNGRGGNNGCSTSVSMIIIVLVFLLSVMGSAKQFQKEDIL